MADGSTGEDDVVSVAEQIARRFWTSGKVYPSAPLIKPRRLHELAYLVPRLAGAKVVTDVGCGDGALLNCLRWLTDIAAFNAIDLQPMPEVSRWPGLWFEQRDAMSDAPYPNAGITLMSGVINYAFDDKALRTMVGNVRSPRLYVRSPCSTGGDQLVNHYSEALGTEYAALYRTPKSVKALIEAEGHFVVADLRRIYPDELESPYGTRQYAFWAVRP